MNRDRDPGSDITDLLTGLAPSRAPERLRSDIRAIASTSRQRPRWLALIKEPPMHLSSRLAVGSPTLRLVSMLVITMALIAALASAAVTGAALLPSPSPKTLPPYGPAANGKLAYEAGGDIHLVDADGTGTMDIVTGDSQDLGPWFSHDGRKVAFVRGPDDTLIVADADGRHPVELLSGPDWWAEFMPSDTEMVVSTTVGDHKGIFLVSVDGGPMRQVDTGTIEPAGWVVPRPPTGDELLFTGTQPPSTDLGLYAVGVDDGLRAVGDAFPLTGSTVTTAFNTPQVSPDGSTVHYWNWEKSGDATSSFMHMRDLSTGAELPVPYGPGHFGVDVRLSPDGTTVLYEGYGGSQAGAGVEGSGSQTQAYLAPVDGREPSRAVGPIYANARKGFDFSPDGTKVIIVANSGPGGSTVASIVDLASDSTTVLPGVTEMPSWQRQPQP